MEDNRKSQNYSEGRTAAQASGESGVGRRELGPSASASDGGGACAGSDASAESSAALAHADRPALSPRIVVPAAALAVFVLLALIGSIASLGSQLMGVSPVLGGTYYVLVAACAVAGIGYPAVRTFRYPVFGISRLTSGNERERSKYARRVADNIIDRASLPGIDRKELLQVRDWKPDRLAAVYASVLEPVVDERIKTAAKASFVTTAVSQTPAFDMLSILAVDLRMIRGVVADCGFRPSALGVGSLYARSLKATLLAGGLEELDYTEMVSLMGGSAALEAGGVLVSSAGQGMANAFFTVRVGVIAKALLLDANPPDMRTLRRQSYRQALTFLKTCGLAEDVRDAAAEAAKAAVKTAAKKAGQAKDAAIEKAASARDQAGIAARSAASRMGEGADALAHRTRDAFARGARATAEKASSLAAGVSAKASRRAVRAGRGRRSDPRLPEGDDDGRGSASGEL
ncbi:DUF697 domain-containing protein [Eggerthellaceae bacterium zg-887]|uniref:DUF697 domain-containing protein n=1 Tax=Xiamenia xianingshaonis TaxID=2682776 RepID=UPI00140ACBCE|nr:DUF697 domain-containing protein [Xiamenia xianingshaonis]NHM15097.1 DUF697 domain-containing protein [Xiamenia xianingshaonis]